MLSVRSLLDEFDLDLAVEGGSGRSPIRWVHISELEYRRVEKVEDVVQEGETMRVKLIGIDNQGRVKLSRKALLEKPEGYVEPEPREERSREGSRRGGRERGGRDRGRGDRGGRGNR